jgi:hypothetical protein
LRCRSETRAQTARIALVSDFSRSECWRFPTRSTVAQNSARPPPIPAALHPAGSDFLKLPKARLFRRFPAAPRAIPSMLFRIALPCARARTHTNVRISAECSNCEQTPAPMIVCRPPYSAEFPLANLLTTLGRNLHGNKSPESLCRLLTNTTAVSPFPSSHPRILLCSDCSARQLDSTIVLGDGRHSSTHPLSAGHAADSRRRWSFVQAASPQSSPPSRRCFRRPRPTAFFWRSLDFPWPALRIRSR